MASTRAVVLVLAGLVSGAVLSGCSSSPAPIAAAAQSSTAASASETVTLPPSTPSPSLSPTAVATTSAPVAALPAAGNPNGHAAIPAAAQAVDTSHPTHVVGTGTGASCTSAAVVAAVAEGGIITFSCGPDPVVITMAETAKVRNASSEVVLDGGGKVTLNGGGQRRILYMDTCDPAQGWTTSHCQNQEEPRLVVQNLIFEDGNSTGQTYAGGGGGAVFVNGGQFKVVNSRFLGNRCDTTGPDLGGAAIRALEQWQGQPVYIVDSTFGGAPGQGGSCSNGGALSSIGVSWVVLNSVMTYNTAVGNGANPAVPGTPGGGSGGAIYTDGNQYTVTIAGSVIEDNQAKEGGGAVFFVSNNRTGTLGIQDSVLRGNPSDGFSTAGYPGIFFLGAGKPNVQDSTLD